VIEALRRRRLSFHASSRFIEIKNEIPTVAAAIRVPRGSAPQRSTISRYATAVAAISKPPRMTKPAIKPARVRLIANAPEVPRHDQLKITGQETAPIPVR
jgi:hypothetical protein